MLTLHGELQSYLSKVITPDELHTALSVQDWATRLPKWLPPVATAKPGVWFGDLTQLIRQHGVEDELLALLKTLRPLRAEEIQKLADRFAAAKTTLIRHNLPDDPPTPTADARDRWAIILRARIATLPDVFLVAEGPGTVESVYVSVRLTGELRALGGDADAAFGGAQAKAPLQIGDLTGHGVGPEQPEPLESVLKRPHTRWVLLGDPGSGKTTMLRHAALKLLKDPSGPLPIYLTITEIEQGIEPALKRLCEEKFGAPDLTQWAYRKVLNGKAVLLLDGLDEVANVAAARDWLIKLAVNVGTTTVLVIASRATGYVPLSIDFVTLALCPLGVEEQRALLSRWVPDPPRVSVALERLSRSPRLRRLAENPLLLTLAGLVLRVGGDVPKRRAELYAKALDVLVHRRHNPEDFTAPMLTEPGLAMELLGWAALRLHGQESDVYPRGALIAALEGDEKNRARLTQHWGSTETFIAEVATRTGLLIPDTGRVKGATAYSFPHRTFREFLAATALERDMREWAAGLEPQPAAPPKLAEVKPPEVKPPEGSAAVEEPQADEATWFERVLAWLTEELDRLGLGEEEEEAGEIPVAAPVMAPPTAPPTATLVAPPVAVLPPPRSELTRVLDEGKARPERWSEVLALTCGRLGHGGADALVRLIAQTKNTALLLRVVADAEGISAETVRETLKLKEGWVHTKARQQVIEELPALVNDLAVAVGLLEQVAKSTTCGHDLYWVREVLRRIERGEVAGDVRDGSVEDARRAAKGAADNVLSHLSPARRAKLLGLLKPWWRAIPIGSFEMGNEDFSNEGPVHPVTFTSGFQMLGVPVTWAMYRLFDPEHDKARRSFEGRLPTDLQDDVPVYNVSWCAAVMFAEWVGARLPLEPEWEYACRAGTTTRFWSGDADDDLARVGWTAQNSGDHPHRVAEKPENPWRLHDVHGNVLEWCVDVYDPAAYARRAEGLIVDSTRLTYTVVGGTPEPLAASDRRASRVVRGGSWSVAPGFARSGRRSWDTPLNTNWVLGFRLVLPESAAP